MGRIVVLGCQGGGGSESEPGWREVCLLWWRGVVGDGPGEA